MTYQSRADGMDSSSVSFTASITWTVCFATYIYNGKCPLIAFRDDTFLR